MLRWFIWLCLSVGLIAFAGLVVCFCWLLSGIMAVVYFGEFVGCWRVL